MFHYPPRRMRADAAAHWMGVSESTFLARVADGSYPAGLRDGGVRVWLRDDLDRVIDRQFGVTAGGPANDLGAEDDPFAARFSKAS